MKKGLFASALVAAGLLFGVATADAAEYHNSAKQTLICYDCHTMHASVNQGFSASDPYNDGRGVWADPAGDPNGNVHLLKGDGPSATCMLCHDNQTFAPDVVGVNTNSGVVPHRSAGALTTGSGDYEDYKGHTIGSMDEAPGSSGGYTVGEHGLECNSCHAQHGGPGDPFRMLASWGPPNGPTYSIGTSQDTTKDVWVNTSTVTVGNGSLDADYYSYDTITFSRDASGTNAIVGDVCGKCHNQFHGGLGSEEISGEVNKTDPVSGGTIGVGFTRHPASYVTLGDSHGSNRDDYLGGTHKTRVLSNEQDLIANNPTSTTEEISPFCLSCHKAHGNQNPFGLFFLSQSATAVNEQGGYAAGQDTSSIPVGFRNLCGQCHGQGND